MEDLLFWAEWLAEIAPLLPIDEEDDRMVREMIDRHWEGAEIVPLTRVVEGE